MGGSSFCLTQ